MEPHKIIFQLTELTDKEFVEIFYSAVAERKPIDGESGRRFVLAETSDSYGDIISTSFVAEDNKKHYPQGWSADALISQNGRCNECGVSIVSISKQAICPICNTEAYCT
ncbi:MAG TPA: hypothetical protein DD473_13505 [Planctomycetaceae bacterium]|nr:hypothetical protein [Planctomycetaceae bacterium]|tara:strand:+ start:30 stop:356 length:327 start_codon:yes stop_codon:yes gene_type:complete